MNKKVFITDGLYELLEYVKEQRAIDFNAYRPSTIKRRLELRFSASGMPDYASYHNYIRENPKELDLLMDVLTIKVSYFFRNPLVFEVLSNIVLPELLETHRNDVLRIWCAGCARGEEAYSIAILLKEITAKEGSSQQIFIIGTDIDKEVLKDAREAVYNSDSLLEVKKRHLDEYFISKDGLYRVKDEIKSMVSFAYHDVTTLTTPKEGIFSDYHLILCRNAIIYFDRDLSDRVLKGFAGFIQSNGYLTVGETESLSAHIAGNFQEVMPGIKIFKKS